MIKVERPARTNVDSDKLLKLHCPAMLLQILLLWAANAQKVFLRISRDHKPKTECSCQIFKTALRKEVTATKITQVQT